MTTVSQPTAATREALGPTLVRLAQEGLDIVVVDGDLGASTTARVFGKADGAPSVRRLKLYARTRATLTRLGTVATRADARGRLGVPLAPLQAALTLVLGVVPG